MFSDPKSRTLTAEQLAMLAEIFRLIPREIRDDSDKEKLAPGELGISYVEGALYFRNPYTGELFSPTHSANLIPVLDHYNPNNRTFNADTVGRVTVYSKLYQLENLPIEYTPDTTIRQMLAPSVFFGRIAYDNYEQLGWPSKEGLCIIHKASVSDVHISFYDSNSFSSYTGRYNATTHQFINWSIDHMISTSGKTEGSGTDIYVNQDKELHDLDFVTIQVTGDIAPHAKITFNGLEAMPIVDVKGEPIESTIAANNCIMLLFDEASERWILADPYRSPEQTLIDLLELRQEADKQTFDNKLKVLENQIREGLEGLYEVMTERIAATNERIDTTDENVENVNQRVTDVNEELSGQITTVDERVTGVDDRVTGVDDKVGLVSGHVTQVEERVVQLDEELDNTAESLGREIASAREDATSQIDEAKNELGNEIDSVRESLASTDENLAQTNLRVDTNAQAIVDTNTRVDERLEALRRFIEERPGNIRSTVYNYTAEADGVSLLAVEGYDATKDKLLVNYGQTTLRIGLDYVIDTEINGVRLLNGVTLDTGEVVQFIILKQA